MSRRPPSPTTTASAHRFALIVDGLCQAAAARMGGKGAPVGASGAMMILLWTRLRRMAAWFASLAARGGVGRRTAARRRIVALRAAAPAPRRCLPRRFAWLIRLVPAAACYGTQLQHLFAEPEIEALLAASPGAWRRLRPLCRMLALPPISEPSRAQPKPPLAPATPVGPPSRALRLSAGQSFRLSRTFASA